MQTIPTAIKTLLKSRSMIGADAPKVIVTFRAGSQAGQVSKSFPSNATSGLGWRFSDQRLFAADSAIDTIFVLDENGLQYDSWLVDDFPNGCDIDGDDDDLIWMTHPSDRANPGIKAWRISTKTRIVNFPNPTGSTDINGIAAPSGPYLWIGDSALAGGELYKVNKSDGVIVATYSMPIRVSGVAWDGANLWVSGLSNTIYKVDPANGQTIESFVGPQTGYAGLTWDGQNLWGGSEDSGGIIVRFSTTDLPLQVSNCRIGRDGAALAQLADIEWPNVNPVNPVDVGYYSPDRSAAEGFIENEWKGVIMPGRDFTVQTGYGSNLVDTFKGQIDDVTLNAQPSLGSADYMVSISCRDDGWRLIDKLVYDSAVDQFRLTYTNQTVEAVVSDLLVKAGWTLDLITTEPTGITVASITFENESYADAMEWCMKVSGFELVILENGEASFYYPTDRQPKPPVPDQVALTGTTAVNLSNKPIVSFSEIVKSLDDLITHTKLADPATLPSNAGYGVAFSTDGTYMSVAHYNTPYITIYKRSGDVFTKLTNPSALPSNTAYGVAFSADGVYMSVAHDLTPFLTIYKRSGDVFTKLANPSVLPTGTGRSVAFSADGVYMSVAHSTSPCITIYKRSGDVFTKLADPATLPSNAGRGVAFSADGVYMSVAHNTSPYITIYKRSGDVFTKLTNPTVLPMGNGYGVAFSTDGTYMSVAHYNTPYITIYKRSGDVFTKLTNPSVLPTGTGNSVAFSNDGTYMSVGCDTPPYVIIYKSELPDLITYVRTTDYTMDYALGTIARTATSSIPDGATVKVDYVFAAWVFKEGEDLFSLPYKITRRNIYGKIKVIGGEDPNSLTDPKEKFTATYVFSSRATFGIPDEKVLIVEMSELDSNAKCQLAANQMGNDMIRRVREVSFSAVAVPWLQPGDCVQVIESASTISEIYRITSIDLELDPEGFIMTCAAYHYGYTPI